MSSHYTAHLLVLLWAAGVAIPAGDARAQEPAGPPTAELRTPPTKALAGRCGEWVKFTVTMVDDLPQGPMAAGELRTETATIWEGPYTEAVARDRTRAIAFLGAWGTTWVGGYHNTAYAREYFPPERVVRTRYEHDCRR